MRNTKNTGDAYSKEPSFKETGLSSPITEFALAMVACKGESCRASGTATLIGPRLAITAKHVSKDYWEIFEEAETQDSSSDVSVVYRSGHFTIYVSQYLHKDRELAIWIVKRAWSSPCTDITLLLLDPANQNAVDYQYKSLAMNLIPPVVGSRVVGFGYHSPVVRMKDGKLEWKTAPTTTVGEVVEVHHEFRDAVRLSFPCFRTNARFDGAMSGGPVFSPEGKVCGIICSNIPPFSDTEDHISYVTSLWPMMNTLVDLDWEGCPAQSPYPVLELAKLGYISAVNWERVTILDNGVGISKYL